MKDRVATGKLRRPSWPDRRRRVDSRARAPSGHDLDECYAFSDSTRLAHDQRRAHPRCSQSGQTPELLAKAYSWPSFDLRALHEPPSLVTLERDSAPSVLFSAQAWSRWICRPAQRQSTRSRRWPHSGRDAAIRYAINHPLGTDPLYAKLRPGMKVTIAIGRHSLRFAPMRRRHSRAEYSRSCSGCSRITAWTTWKSWSRPAFTAA